MPPCKIAIGAEVPKNSTATNVHRTIPISNGFSVLTTVCCHRRNTDAPTSPTAIALTPFKKMGKKCAVRYLDHSGITAVLSSKPGAKMPIQARNAPSSDDEADELHAMAPQNAAKLNMGPSKTWALHLKVNKTLWNYLEEHGSPPVQREIPVLSTSLLKQLPGHSEGESQPVRRQK